MARTHCCLNVGPLSSTLSQLWNSVGQVLASLRVYCHLAWCSPARRWRLITGALRLALMSKLGGCRTRGTCVLLGVRVVIPTGRYSDRSIFRQVDIPTGRYSDRSIFRQTVSYSDRSLFRQVDSPTNRSLFRQFDSSTNRSIFRKVYIPTGRYCDIKIIVMRGLTTINSYCGDE